MFNSASDDVLGSVLKAMNDLRQYPQTHVSKIDSLYLEFIGPNGIDKRSGMQYNEGQKAILEAKEFLKVGQPIDPLKLDFALTAAAYNHSCHMMKTDDLTHEGLNDETLHQRVNVFAKTQYFNEISENIALKDCDNHVVWVLDWVIDDGLPDRFHRGHLFNPAYEKVGIGICPTAKGDEKFVTAIFTEKGFVGDELKIPEDVKVSSGILKFKPKV